jgi:hypothetical protein
VLPTKFRFIWLSSFREEDFQKSTNQKQEWPVVAMFIMDGNQMSNLYKKPSKDASYQILIHLAKRLQRGRFFRNQPIRNNNCQWRPCLLTDLDEMSNLYRRLSIDASYQISVHLSKRFQRRRFLKSANQKQTLPMVAMFVNGLILELNVQSL